MTDNNQSAGPGVTEQDGKVRLSNSSSQSGENIDMTVAINKDLVIPAPITWVSSWRGPWSSYESL